MGTMPLSIRQCKRAICIARFLQRSGVPEWSAWMLALSGKRLVAVVFGVAMCQGNEAAWISANGHHSPEQIAGTVKLQRKPTYEMSLYVGARKEGVVRLPLSILKQSLLLNKKFKSLLYLFYSISYVILLNRFTTRMCLSFFGGKSWQSWRTVSGTAQFMIIEMVGRISRQIWI